MSTLGERIRAVRKAQKPKMNQDEFAKSLGVTVPMIHTYENDKVVPNGTFMMLLCRTYHINSLWLETGEGEMIASETSAPCDTARYQQNIHDKSPLEGLDKLTLRAVKQFLQLPQETREQLFRMMKAIVTDETGDE